MESEDTAALYSTKHASFEANQKELNEDRPILSAARMHRMLRASIPRSQTIA